MTHPIGCASAFSSPPALPNHSRSANQTPFLFVLIVRLLLPNAINTTQMSGLSLHAHIATWLIVGASVGLFALAGIAIERLRPIRNDRCTNQ